MKSLWSQGVLSRTQRLSLATAGAVAIHGLLFVSGWLVIQQISIPSNQNRVMVLTLESTPFDGLLDNQTKDQQTVNDAQLGEIASLPERDEPSELSQISTAPHPKATFEINPELLPEPLPEIESASEFSEADTAQIDYQATPTAPAPVQNQMTQAAGAEFHIDESLDSSSRAHEDLLTADVGALTIQQDAAELPANPGLVISTKQQRMIERRLKKWISKISAEKTLDSSFSWRHKGQTYVAKLSHLPASGPMELDEIVVEVNTEQDGQALSTVMRLKKLAFSSFAQFVHRWDPRVMIHDDVMQGRFHSNSQILLDYDRRVRPVFHGKVTTASSRIDFESFTRGKTRKEIFRGGLETGVKKIRMPKPQLLFTDSADNVGKDTIRFDRDTRLIFTADGGLMYEPIDEAGAPRYRPLPNVPVYLVADEDVTLWVSGEVKGKIMVYSPKRIIIESNLTYADGYSNHSEDVIGLISGRDVVVAREEITGRGNLTINASIYARQRFVVRDFAKPHSGTLKIVGSLSAGSIGATQPRFGTHIEFDQRFERLRPPGFPITDRYEVSRTEGAWHPSDGSVLFK